MTAEIVIGVFAKAIVKSIMAAHLEGEFLKHNKFFAELGSEIVDFFGNKADASSNSEAKQIIRLANDITRRFRSQFKVANLPEEELKALLFEFEQTFIDFDIHQLLAARLDANRLATDLIVSRSHMINQFALQERILYERLIQAAAQGLVQIESSLPSFKALLDAAMLQHFDNIEAGISIVQKKQDQLWYYFQAKDQQEIKQIKEFEEKYRKRIIKKLNQHEIFGVPKLNKIIEDQKLSISYVTVEIEKTGLKSHVLNSGIVKRLGLDIENDSINAPINRLLEEELRIVIRGMAGSGKTTLLRWLAVKMAEQSFEDNLGDWNQLIPFYIQLRKIDQTGFPTHDQYVSMLDPELTSLQPDKNWAHQYLENGRAVLLIDGLDELVQDQHETFLERLKGLVDEYPLVRYIVTSRPAATRQDNWSEWFNWTEKAEFKEVTISAMSKAAVNTFIDHWHKAYIEGSKTKNAKEILQLAQDLKRLLQQRSALHNLAENPLLCSMICTLHMDHLQNLPIERTKLYDECISMMLERDTGRKIFTSSKLRVEQKRILLQSLAFRMMRNEEILLPIERVKQIFADKLPKFGPSASSVEIECKDLIERCGLLREPAVDEIDFIHRTFQEYLAAREIVSNAEWGYLLQQSTKEQWRDTFPLAVGVMRENEAEYIIGELIKPERSLPERIIGLTCLETVPLISPELSERVVQSVSELFPPFKNEYQRLTN